MKFIWEADDICPNRKYTRPGIKEVWMIGYLASTSYTQRYVSVSMSDGMVTDPSTKDTMAAMLTKNGYVPVEFLKA